MGLPSFVNSLQQYFSNKISQPKFGEGKVLFGPDVLPAVLLWIRVDDILIHAPTKSKLEKALTHILQTTIRLGLIYHISKTSPPSQRVKLCGFEYATSSVPTLCIPQNKSSRAIEFIDYLLSGLQPFITCLVVSMVLGYLQSLVPAAPVNIGANFLRPMYDDLHSLTDKQILQTKQSYFCAINLSIRIRQCLQWWVDALVLGLSR